jgi:hypothetical protein
MDHGANTESSAGVDSFQGTSSGPSNLTALILMGNLKSGLLAVGKLFVAGLSSAGR